MTVCEAAAIAAETTHTAAQDAVRRIKGWRPHAQAQPNTRRGGAQSSHETTIEGRPHAQTVDDHSHGEQADSQTAQSPTTSDHGHAADATRSTMDAPSAGNATKDEATSR